jgi:V8-like Glu-specific endopeptidase
MSTAQTPGKKDAAKKSAPATPKPLGRHSVGEEFKARAPRRDELLPLTTSIFVAGAERLPAVKTHVVPVERKVEGRKVYHYQIRLEVDGVRLGVHASPPPLRGTAVDTRIPQEKLKDFEKHLAAFVPDHLAVEPHPKRLLKAIRRIPEHLDKKKRYNTTIFAPDERKVFQDTSYPWSALGRCETNFGPFSGVLIGPRHLLTCNHGIDWTPPPGFAADWLTFTPAYFDGNAPFGSTYATHIYWVKKDNNNGVSDGDEGQYDYVVLVLNDRIGEKTGWLGTRRYSDSWDPLAAWWHIGYPADITSMQRPTFQSWFTMNGDDTQSDDHEIIRHQADVFPGQSGGPMFGFWAGDAGPRAVAVQSWQNASTNGASGGGDLVDLAIRARNDHP